MKRQEHLVLASGPRKGERIPIEGTLTIGRHPDNILAVDDLQVSRRHAVVEQHENNTVLRDLNSGNGTYVGEHRVGEYRLKHGDLLRIGDVELRFESNGGEPTSMPADEENNGVRFRSEVQEDIASNNAESVYETFFAEPQEATSEELKETQRRLQAVYRANQIIASERTLSLLFERVMEQIFALVPAHNGVIMLRDRKSGALRTGYVRSGAGDKEMTVSSTIVDRAFEQGEAVLTRDAADDSRFSTGESIMVQNIASAMCVPLTHQGERLGIIYVDTRGTTNAFVSSDLELFAALAGASAVAIRNAQHVQDLEQSYSDTLLLLANAIEARDHYTVGHTWRVTNFSIEVARALGWPPEKLEEVQMGGVLHDIGKIAVNDAILRKPGQLTDEEYEQIKIHPQKGAQMLQDVARLHPLIPYCLYHHERFDGKGYPSGLKGEDVPIEGRLMAVADTFDALTSNRPYRKGFPPEKAIDIIKEGRGTQFDPACADALIQAYNEGLIMRLLQDYNRSGEKSVACPFCSTYVRPPETAEVGETFTCDVCHRPIRLLFENDAYYAELMSQSGVLRGLR